MQERGERFHGDESSNSEIAAGCLCGGRRICENTAPSSTATECPILWIDAREPDFMSPTVFRYKGYRFFFFSREESRIHIHVYCGNGEAKFWLEPNLELAENYGLTPKQLREVQGMIEEHRDEIINSWKTHLGG